MSEQEHDWFQSQGHSNATQQNVERVIADSICGKPDSSIGNLFVKLYCVAFKAIFVNKFGHVYRLGLPQSMDATSALDFLGRVDTRLHEEDWS